MGRADIEVELDRLVNVHDQLESLLVSAATGWEKEYLQLRRALQEQIARLCKADAELHLSEEDRRLFRDAFGNFRSATALHQADWPVVTIVRDDPAYRQSADNVGLAYHKFMTVMRELLDQ